MSVSQNSFFKVANAKPFLKWAGGKTQILNDIKNFLPAGFAEKEITYIEPFAGSGAVLFSILSSFSNIQSAVINDVNEDLINVYRVIAEYPEELIVYLKQLEYEYLSLNGENQKEYFYAKRSLFNLRSSSKIIQAALFIFLNRTCFNGLYRVNKNNCFNVPVGSYKKPLICNSENILAVSAVLQKVEILTADFEKTYEYASEDSFFYFDPPYKPITVSSSFNSYSKDKFDDEEQIRLYNFCVKLDKNNIKWMLSNSDVKSADAENYFFDELYSGFNIRRVKATRRINSNAQKRGLLNELIITNY